MPDKDNFWGGKALADQIRGRYGEGQQDYYLEPLVLVDSEGSPLGRIQNGDGAIFCCRRGERELQLTEAFTDPDFDHFDRPEMGNLHFVILTMYHEKLKHLPIAFAPSQIKDTLGEVIGNNGLRQLRVAEFEKFAHITFFLNGGASDPFVGEDDVRIPSPKGVAYDTVPELSLAQVTEQVVEGIKGHYDFIATNFANGDVIGHIGNNEAKVECASLIDTRLGETIDAAVAEDYVVLVTADHGIFEVMTHPDGRQNVGHTTNLVPLVLIDPRSHQQYGLRDGKFSDIAPTILSAMHIPQPELMDGINLAPDHDWGGNRRVLLIILDGWGIGEEDDTNPISIASTPVWDQMLTTYPHSQLRASGDAVGLKASKAGNSEAGHSNIGAGRVVPQDDMRLDLAMEDGSFFTNQVFCEAIDLVKHGGNSLHLIGLLSEKSSHGSMRWPVALLGMAKAHGLEEVYLHMIIDGRSTEPGSAPVLLEKLEDKIAEIGIGKIVSGVGRGIALDRDGNYGKTKRAFDGFVLGAGRQYRKN